MTRRVWVLVAVLASLLAVRLGIEGYRWVAYADEREQLAGVRGRLVDAGVEVFRTRMSLDTLRKEIETEDRALARERRALDAYDSKSERGTLPRHLYAAYRAELDRYNEHVARRNVRFREWRATITRNHASVDRYNALIDSARVLAQELGDPYYAIPTPLEAAVERGVIPEKP